MPLWEPRKDRNRRLFREALGAAVKRAASVVTDEYLLAVHTAWLLGGSVAANIAVDMSESFSSSSLKKAWGRGDEKKARALTQVFALAMISPWHRSTIPPQYSDEARTSACEIAASNVVTIFDITPHHTVGDFLKMDAQFNYERDWIDKKTREGTPTLRLSLLWTQAQLACAGRHLDLASVTFPTDLRGYVEQGGYLDHGIGFLLVSQAYAAGLDAMWQSIADRQSSRRKG